jgi:DNA (cytosine-5)-methyltransferase 1
MMEFAAVDLFCGAGGMTYGFRRAGIPVKVGVDIDPSCRYPIEQNNPGTRFIEKSVTKLKSRDVAGW